MQDQTRLCRFPLPFRIKTENLFLQNILFQKSEILKFGRVGQSPKGTDGRVGRFHKGAYIFSDLCTLDNGLDHLMTVKKVYVEFNGEKGTLP